MLEVLLHACDPAGQTYQVTVLPRRGQNVLACALRKLFGPRAYWVPVPDNPFQGRVFLRTGPTPQDTQDTLHVPLATLSILDVHRPRRRWHVHGS